MKTMAISAKNPQELEAKLEKALSLDFNPRLAFVFASVAQPLDQVRNIFHSRKIAVFGCTTSGEIVNESIFDECISVMLFDLPENAFALRLFDAPDLSSLQRGGLVGTWARSVFASPALLVFSAGMTADGEAILKGITDELGGDAPVFGGLAGDDFKFQSTFAFTGTEITGAGVLALALDSSKVEVNGLAVSGWKGVGTMKTITRSEGNVVFSIDDQPALDFYSRYLSVDVNDNQTLAVEYPLLLQREDGTFVLRAALLINPDKSLVFAGAVPEGSKVQFSLMPSTEIIDFALDSLTKFKQTLTGVDAVILVSCKARHLALGPMIDDEIAALNKLWNTPMAGFFSYGELGPNVLGRCDFHNMTLSIITLRAK